MYLQWRGLGVETNAETLGSIYLLTSLLKNEVHPFFGRH